jgi:hypothetical protein
MVAHEAAKKDPTEFLSSKGPYADRLSLMGEQIPSDSSFTFE